MFSNGNGSESEVEDSDDDEDGKPECVKPFLKTPQEALAVLYTAEDWHSLICYAEQASKDVNLDCLLDARVRKLCDMPQRFFNRRYL